MKHIRTYLIGTIVVFMFTTGINAQTVNLKPAPANITINGMADEWGDNLPFTNDKAKLNYTISNDKTNLYLVVKTKDAAKQSDILGSGITFSVNTKGKKSTTYSITFPARVPKEDPTGYIHLDPTQTQEKAVQTKYKKIKPEGFKDIKDEQLGTSNAYGIQVAIGYDDAGNLVYEESIPLTLFHVEGATDKEWAFNIKINGLERDAKAVTAQMYGSNVGNGITGVTVSGANGTSANTMMNGASINGGKVTAIAISERPANFMLTQPVDFWEKYILAK